MLLLLFLACTGSSNDDTGGAAGAESLATLDLAQAVADKGIAAWPAEVQPGDWMQTVWAFGLLRLHDATGDAAYRDYAQAWMDDQVVEYTGDDSPVVSSDSASPAIIAAMLDDAAHQPIRDAADAYLQTVPLTSQGAWEHWTDAAPFGVVDQVWVDSQFMLGQYLLERLRHDPATTIGGQAAADLFTQQYRLFSQLCRDPADQLYRHA